MRNRARLWVLVAVVIALSACGIAEADPTGDRPGEWRTVTSPSGETYECYVVAGYRSAAMECFKP